VNYKDIQLAAENLIMEYLKKCGGQFEPPIPVEAIADVYLGFTIDRIDLGSNVAGKLSLEEKIIQVNDSDIFERQNFTIAHELGHIRLHTKNEQLIVKLPFAHDNKTIMCRKTDRAKVEMEANHFASNLLMPKICILAEHAKVCDRKNEEKIKILAVKFKTSKAAMRYRLENLKLLVDENQLALFK